MCSISRRRAIGGATTQIVDGVNAGKSAATDAAGVYSLSDLAPGDFNLRVSAAGYAARTQPVTLQADAQLTVVLQAAASRLRRQATS